MVENKIRKIEREEIVVCEVCNNAIPINFLEKSAGGIKNLYCQYCGVSLNITYDLIDNNVISESLISSSNTLKGSNSVNIQQNSQESDLALSYSNIKNALRRYFFQLIYQLLKSTPLTQRKIQNKKELKSSHINIILKKLWKELKDLNLKDLATQEMVSSKRRIRNYFEEFQSSLRPYKNFRKKNFALFAENIEFVFGLILGDYEFSNLTTSKKRIVLDLKKNFGFKSDTATTNSFTYTISLIISKKIRSILNQYHIIEGNDNKLAFDEIIGDVIDYIVNNKVKSSDLTEFNNSKKKKFYTTLEIIIKNVKIDWIYRKSFDDHIYKLILIVNSLMSDADYSSNLIGFERLISQGLRQSALFEKDQDFSSHFKLNLTLILSRVIYLKIKKFPNITKLNSQSAKLRITDENLIKNSILDEITAGKKINSQILKKFYKLPLEEFQTYYDKLQQKLGLDLIYVESFREYISDLVRLVFNIVNTISKKSYLTKLELAVIRDLSNYNFEWFNKKPERTYFYYLNLSNQSNEDSLEGREKKLDSGKEKGFNLTQIESKFLEKLIKEGFKKKHLANLFEMSERDFYNFVFERLKMNFKDAKDEYFYKPKIINLYENGYKASQMASALSDVKESEIKYGFSKNTIYNSIKRIWNEKFGDFNNDFTALDNYLSNKYRKTEKKEMLTFDEKFRTNLTKHIKCLMNSVDFKVLGIQKKLVDSEKVINIFKKYKLYTSLGLKNPIYASAVSLFMYLLFHKDLDTLILNKTKYSKILSINDDMFSKYYNGYCKRISLNVDEYKSKIFQNIDNLLDKLSIKFNISLSEEIRIGLINRAKDLYEFFNKFESSKIIINDIVHKGDYELYHPRYVGAMLIHFFKDEPEFIYKVNSGNKVTHASLDHLRDLLGIGSTQRLRLLYENRVEFAEKYLKRRLKCRKISDKEISSFLKKNKDKEEVKLVNLLLKCSNLNLRKLLKITGMFEGKVNIALEELSETGYYFKLETLEKIILPFIQSIKNYEKSNEVLVGYKNYRNYHNEKIRKTSEKARKREKEEKEKYGNNFKSIEVRILRFLQTLGFSYDDYNLVSHLRDLNYSSTENTAIFHHSDAVKENDEISNLLFLPKKRKVDSGKDVSYTYHSHSFVHTEEGMNRINKFLRILCNSTENNDSKILNDLQFLNWNQDSIELAKYRLTNFDWVHHIYDYLPKYGDWKKINFKKLNRLVGKYLHPIFKKSKKIIEQDFKTSWERYLERMKENRKKKYEKMF